MRPLTARPTTAGALLLIELSSRTRRRVSAVAGDDDPFRQRLYRALDGRARLSRVDREAICERTGGYVPPDAWRVSIVDHQPEDGDRTDGRDRPQLRSTVGACLLDAYLRREKTSQARFAWMGDLSTAKVSRILDGLLSPTLADAFHIEELTQGAVPARSWLVATRESVSAAAAG